MARCGVMMLSSPLVPTATGTASQRDVFVAGNLGWSSSPLHGLGVKGGVIRLVGLDSRRCRPSRASIEDNSDNGASTTSTSEKEDLSAKLAAAEAEAEALRKELAARKGSSGTTDLSKLKPATPEKRIDGTGYRETIFSGPGKTTGKPEQQPSKWGLSEAELFLSKGAPTEGSGLGLEAMEAGSQDIINRRLIIGVGITALAVGLAFLKFPTGRPSKPLFLYVVSILQLQRTLKSLEDSVVEVEELKGALRRAGRPDEIKSNLLNAAAWLDGENADKASQLSFEIYEYVDQADYSRYFENLGEPNAVQQMEFLKFGLQSIKAARKKVDEFLTLIPSEALDAAASQFAR
ncbi:hypothetical protein KC19_2G188900 [Ceratodon purpureus]|uniref:Uncharacterized protein n=1 Tax=Ceratodon purpureus TaxID=3225 RepID=A0A8T0IYC8_CERPU|nr:hypothetical protein KC19_2G188900 [Ceratodon purpureus]